MTDPNNGTLRRIEDNVADMLGKLAKIEVTMAVVARLETDVRKLQDLELRREGAMGAFGWLVKNGPGLVGATFIFILGALAKWVLVK